MSETIYHKDLLRIISYGARSPREEGFIHDALSKLIRYYEEEITNAYERGRRDAISDNAWRDYREQCS